MMVDLGNGSVEERVLLSVGEGGGLGPEADGQHVEVARQGSDRLGFI